MGGDRHLARLVYISDGDTFWCIKASHLEINKAICQSDLRQNMAKLLKRLPFEHTYPWVTGISPALGPLNSCISPQTLLHTCSEEWAVVCDTIIVPFYLKLIIEDDQFVIKGQFWYHWRLFIPLEWACNNIVTNNYDLFPKVRKA